jgi:hypothetical protein
MYHLTVGQHYGQSVNTKVRVVGQPLVGFRSTGVLDAPLSKQLAGILSGQ